MEDGRTRIVCTVGPASAATPMLSRMMSAGMDIARLNFSHGTHDEHAELMDAVRKAAKKSGKLVAILQDLQGAKIRVGELPKKGITLHSGQTVTFSGAKGAKYSATVVPLPFERLGKDVKKGHRILLDDGAIETEVIRVKGNTVTVSVITGGLLTSHKGANFPDSEMPGAAFTKKDEADLLFGIAHNVDWVCVSFVHDADTLVRVRAKILKEARRLRVRPPLLMAKVETKAAVLNLDAILEACDAVMLGRGDLGIEVPGEEVPVIQKEVAHRARMAGKPVIIATQMLESMRENPRATRAEISDVANAVFDHADAVMLSAESATGRYPAVTVQAMASVIREAEASRFDALPLDPHSVNCIPSAIGHHVALMAEKGLIRAVVLGSSAAPILPNIAMFRPEVPIVLVTPDEKHARQLMLYSGTVPIILDDRGGSFVPRLHSLIHARLKLPKGQALAYVTVLPRGGVSLSLLPL